MTQSHLPKYNRSNKEVRFVFTERDLEILLALNRCRYLRTNQVKRLVFPKNKTVQPTRRRLKYLYHNKFITRIMPFMPVGHGSGEAAYCLDRDGMELLRDQGESVNLPNKAGQVKYQFLNHALDLSDFRIHLELALLDHPKVELDKFISDFEIKSHTKQAVGRKIYKLYDEVVHPVNRERYVVYPDALIIFKGKGEFANYQTLYFLEIDRGTESLGVIRKKLIGYNIYYKENIFKKFGKFKGFRVLFQTSSEKRAKNIRQTLTDQEGADMVWITAVEKVDESTVIDGKIWIDERHEWRSILKSG